MPNPTPIKAIVYVCAAFLSFTTMSMLNKISLGFITRWRLCSYRNASALVLAMLFILATALFPRETSCTYRDAYCVWYGVFN